MIEIVFETHATSVDNEAKIASGTNDVALSELGREQARQLGQRYRNETFDLIFCSELQRSYRTAEIAFSGRGFSLLRDARLNECNYGQLNGYSSSEIEMRRADCIDVPFPGGESYQETTRKMKGFLSDLQKHEGKRVMIIGHRATQYALEHLVRGVSLSKAVTDIWTWQPGWIYSFNLDSAVGNGQER